METVPKISVAQFAHWSRSGIISLIKTISSSSDELDFSLLLLEGDEEFEGFYDMFSRKAQLHYSKGKLNAIANYKALIKKYNPDIIHVHSLTPWMLASFFSSKRPTIFHLHCDYPYLFKRDLKSKLKQGLLWLCANYSNSKLVSVSESSAERLKEITGKDVAYIPNGIPDTGLQRALFESRPDTIKFYSVCRLDPEKNISGAIKLVAQLIKEGYNLSYHIYGNGNQFSKLEHEIQQAGVGERIRLMGFHTAPQDLPVDYDFYLSTSIQEGMSLSALHALRGRTPLVSTSVGQIGRVIKDGVNGFIIGHDPQLNLEKLKAIIAIPPQQLAHIQTAGRQLFLKNFTLDIFLTKTYEIYRHMSRSIIGS